MIKSKGFINTGNRNKGILWEHLSAVSYRDLQIPRSKFRLTKVLDFGMGPSNQHCLYIDDIENTKQIIVDEINSKLYTPEFFEEIRNYYTDPLNDFRKRVASFSVADASSKQLLEIFDQFYTVAGLTYPPMLLTFLSTNLDDFFTGEIEKVAKDDSLDINEIKAILLIMQDLSFAEEEESAIYKVITSIKNNQNYDSKSAIKDLVKNYGWIHMEYGSVPAQEDYYEEIIDERISSGNIYDPIVSKEEILEKQKKFFEQYSDSRLKYVVEVLQKFNFILDDSKTATVECHFIIYPVLIEMAKRLGMELAGLYYLTSDEIHQAFIGKLIEKKEIEERKKLRVVLLDEGNIQVFSGEKAKEIADKYIYADEIKDEKIVKGLVAFSGYYKGTVCVISGVSDKSKFNHGDVMVANDGSPELNYFLQRAGAIVTDKGGIISHAAIVARESKIPAVLGTKIATKVFKDGDVVEVDAKNGTVKLIDIN